MQKRNELWRNTTSCAVQYLSQEVEGEPGEEDVGEELGDAEHTVHHPVGQPFGVVLFSGALDGFDSADMSRVTHTLGRERLKRLFITDVR